MSLSVISIVGKNSLLHTQQRIPITKLNGRFSNTFVFLFFFILSKFITYLRNEKWTRIDYDFYCCRCTSVCFTQSLLMKKINLKKENYPACRNPIFWSPTNQSRDLIFFIPWLINRISILFHLLLLFFCDRFLQENFYTTFFVGLQKTLMTLFSNYSFLTADAWCEGCCTTCFRVQ